MDVVQPIIIDGVDFDVRENLWSALHHLRLMSETRVLWIDTVCINQSTIRERKYQVSQMGRIYSQAKTVVVWLGLSDTASRLFFRRVSRKLYESFVLSTDPAITIETRRELAAIHSVLSQPY